MGQTLTAGGSSLTVIGVLDVSGASSDDADEDDLAVVPITTAQRISGSTSSAVSAIYVEATDADALSAAYQEVRAALQQMTGKTVKAVHVIVQSLRMPTEQQANAPEGGNA